MHLCSNRRQVGVNLVFVPGREGLAIFGTGLYSTEPADRLPGAGFDDNGEDAQAFLVPALQQVGYLF